ncbi:MAG TPA: thiamine pyrophosphate-dependent enzyme, partial [Solirubrobacterales bacterium]|nr:thiamine pyrophosphate-dependent enzyme [Solirubrobacterales bacterium]
MKAVAAIPHGGTGDVKYHYGHQGVYETSAGEKIAVRLYPNPSHLEFVNPVVEGATRFIQSDFEGPKLEHQPKRAVPVLLHGDASFPGQGVVAETLNLRALRGYTTGGTVHVIQNNQVGFTTDPEDARSTPYAADMAKGFNVPIVHVNADDVEACSAAIRLAMAFRERWERDIVIDVIGYRRFGHNETDEPAYTQPEMAARIKQKKPVREIYADQLVREGTITQEEADALAQEIWDELSRRHKALKEELSATQAEQPTGGYQLDRSPSPEVKTAVSADRLLGLNDDLLRIPEGFNVHPKLFKQLERRRETVGPDGGIDWAHAEALAFASLLSEG